MLSIKHQQMVKKNSITIPNFEGDLHTDETTIKIYATDASAYKEYPIAVAIPKTKNDIKSIINYANNTKTPIIARGAGTSLAGQVVGNGIIVDISKHFKNVIELNVEQKWVIVEPGVVLEELNNFLKPYDLFFGPETSTANRCTIGGMVGNNSCGLHSLIYGSARDHTAEITAFLCDGSEVIFGNLTIVQFNQKCELKTFEGDLYRNIRDIYSDKSNIENIIKEFPHPDLKRRNTGYALDQLADCDIFSDSNKTFNFCNLLTGSEGTLSFSTAIKLNLTELPPKHIAVVCAHFKTKEEAFLANLVALKYNPAAVEMMDNLILECTKSNIEQAKNRFFVEGDPGAILMIEFARNSREEIDQTTAKLIEELKAEKFGYSYPIIYDNETKKVWNLRKAGLGVLSNIEGDAKPVSLIEDTAVIPALLPDYMADFKLILDKYGLDCIYHAHIGSGELHLRPVLNLKDKEHVRIFREIAIDVAHLVKKYRGSLSGEHGDGRLRGEFIPIMVGEQNYELFKLIKKTWDPNNIFNPGKIVDTPAMNSFLRYEPGEQTKEIETVFDFGAVGGFIRAVEKCNGSGDCRKLSEIGGTMCPSFMATRDEQNTTRARANTLREYISNSTKKNPFDQKEVYKILDLCLSCKGCKSECPSSVDMAKLKAEFLQHYYDKNGISFRSWLIANIDKFSKPAMIWPALTNFFMQSKITAPLLMSTLGFNPTRRMPKYNKQSLNKWFKKHKSEQKELGTLYFFSDEFTNVNDANIGQKAIMLLEKIGYNVVIADISVSGRTYLSKGLVRTAKNIANKNIEKLKSVITDSTPLIGIEPSAILSFRDEYTDLATPDNKNAATEIAKNTFLFDEFIANLIDKGIITKEMFTDKPQHIKLHGHCQQKAIASTKTSIKILSFPSNYSVEEIPSGCCGMAGSFGYEKEHFEISQKIGELVLFPAVRNSDDNTIIAAPGTSCRHQIKEGTQKSAYHPAEILYDALK